MRAEFQRIGFKDVRMWYQPSNWFYKNGHDYVEKFVKFNTGAASDDRELLDLCAKMFDEESEGTVKTFEKLVILAFKE